MYPMIQKRFKAPVTAIITPVCRAMLRIGLSANAVTIIGSAGVTFSAIYFFAEGSFFIGTLIVSFFALSDLLDGTMARISKTDGTRWGALLDSTLDRISDAGIAIKNEEVSGKEARDLSDAEVITVLSREAKKRREAAEAFEQAGAADRAAKEKAEGVIIAEYLPAQLSESEIKEIIAAAIAESGATGPQQMGQVMKLIQPKIAGRADGGIVSSLVKAALSGGK